MILIKSRTRNLFHAATVVPSPKACVGSALADALLAIVASLETRPPRRTLRITFFRDVTSALIASAYFCPAGADHSVCTKTPGLSLRS